jgi:hypothetical protein
MRHLLIAAVASLALAATAQARPADRGCGLTPRIDGQRFHVVVEHGPVTCREAKRVASHFLRHFTVSRPWHCFLGHGSMPAASCAKGKRVVVRVYAPN